MCLGTQCLRYFNERKTWLDARAHCRKFEADLVEINDWNTFRLIFIYRMISSYLKSENSTNSIWAIASSTLFDNSSNGYSGYLTESTCKNLHRAFSIILFF